MATRTPPKSTPALPLGNRAAGAAAPSTALGVVLIIGLVVAAYFPSLGGGFVLDDDKLLTDNSLIRASDGLYRFWFTTEPYDYWPISNSMLWLEWRLWAMNATGYHITNLLLHIAEVLLIWRILVRLALPGAFLAALLFGLHPVNVESVAWIAQRKSLLAMLFSLLSTLAYVEFEVRAASQPISQTLTNRWYWLSLCAFVAAMLSKVSAAVTPAVLLGIAAWKRPLSKRDLFRLAPFAAVTLLLLRVNIWFRTHGVVTPGSGATLLERLLGAAGGVCFYLYKAILPFNLSFTYPEWHVHVEQAGWWLALLSTAAFTAVLWWYRHSWSRALLWAWGFYVVALLPVLGFTDVGFQQHIVVADHYQHTALIGLLALAAAGWSRWHQQASPPRRTLPRIVAIAVLGVFAVLTWEQSSLYVDATTLYTDTIRKNPDAWMARTNLGGILSEAGRSAEAIAHFQRALEVKPDYPEAHSNLARELEKAGKVDEAMAHYQQALRPNPHFAEAQNNLGDLLLKAGRLQEAIEHFEVALRIKPQSADTHNNLCHAYGQRGDLAKAIGYCQQALQLKPNLAEAHYNLGNFFVQTSRFDDAISQYQQALQTRPDFAEAHGNLGTALAQVGRLPEAIEQYRQAIRLNPGFADAKANLAALLEAESSAKRQQE